MSRRSTGGSLVELLFLEPSIFDSRNRLRLNGSPVFNVLLFTHKPSAAERVEVLLGAARS